MLPSFFVLGAARSGTTSMHYYLAQHPDIRMSAIKEPNHFLFETTPRGMRPLIADDRRLIAKSVPDRHRYESLFDGPARTAAGDVSPLYLYVRETPQLIAAACPDARLIAILREPADRAWSHFGYLNEGLGARLQPAFAAAVREEAPLPYSPYRSGTHCLRLGRYGEQVARYLEHFPAERVLLLRYEDFVATPDATLDRVCAFLGVDAGFRFDTAVRYNPGGDQRSAFGRLDRLVRPAFPYLKRALPSHVAGRLARGRARLRAASTRTPAAPTLDPSTRRLLDDYYAVDLDLLARLTGVGWPDRR